MRKSESDFRAQQVRINNDIREGSFVRVYLLYGEQAYLRNQNRDKLIRAMLGEEGRDSMNFSLFSGADTDIREVTDLADTMPFFTDRRVILLEETQVFSDADAGNALAEYLGVMPETCCLILSQSKVDKRRTLFQACRNTGALLDCDAVGEDDLKKWAEGLFTKAGLEISRRELERFLDGAGTDMLNIASEAEKVIGYCYGRTDRTVRREDLDAVCSPLLKDRIFEMTEAISRREKEKALRIYMELCLLQTAPQVILTLLQRQFRQLILVQEMSADTPDKEIAAYLKVPPFVVSGKFRPCLRLFTKQQLLDALDACVQADLDYKSGKIDAARAVEILILSV